MLIRQPILETRSYNSGIEKIIDFNFLKNRVKPPPFLKLFIETFELDHEKIETEYFLGTNGYLEQCAGIGCSNKYIPHFEYFVSQNHLSENYYGDFKDGYSIYKEKYWIIGGGIGGNEFICVGTQGKTTDQLVLINEEMRTKTCWNDNVFQFFNTFVFSEFRGFADFENLFINWGEDFWRNLNFLDSKPIDLQRMHPTIKRRGFSFLRFRKVESDTFFNEKISVLNLPFRANTFFQFFKFEGEKGFYTFDIFEGKNNQYLSFESIEYVPVNLQGQPIIIKQMYNDEKLLVSIQKYNFYKNADFSDMLEIGKTETNDKIYIVIQGEKAEQVWLVADNPFNEHGDTTIKLADDIFKFIRGFEPVYEEKYFDKVYRKWGEDFWRLKINS